MEKNEKINFEFEPPRIDTSEIEQSYRDLVRKFLEKPQDSLSFGMPLVPLDALESILEAEGFARIFFEHKGWQYNYQIKYSKDNISLLVTGSAFYRNDITLYFEID